MFLFTWNSFELVNFAFCFLSTDNICTQQRKFMTNAVRMAFGFFRKILTTSLEGKSVSFLSLCLLNPNISHRKKEVLCQKGIFWISLNLSFLNVKCNEENFRTSTILWVKKKWFLLFLSNCHRLVLAEFWRKLTFIQYTVSQI